MMLRLVCALLIAAELLLLNLFLAPSGCSAIAFTFVGNPILALGVLLGLLWIWRVFRRIRREEVDRRRAGGIAAGDAD